jgi:hypothetical protein
MGIQYLVFLQELAKKRAMLYEEQTAKENDEY